MSVEIFKLAILIDFLVHFNSTGDLLCNFLLYNSFFDDFLLAEEIFTDFGIVLLDLWTILDFRLAIKRKCDFFKDLFGKKIQDF